MNQNRNLLLLFQAAALLIVPLFLEILWSRQALGISGSGNTPSSLSAQYSDGSTPPTNTPQKKSSKESSDRHSPLRIAWLMSFPNSGTSYTSHFIRKTTGTRTATNYAELRLSRQVLLGMESKESIPVFDDQPTGPFWTDSNETEPTSGFVLTKTHCGAHCVWCGPEKYTQMLHHFRHRCLRSDKLRVANGTKTTTKSFYSPTRVIKAVHLIRNPLDNVVSRFRYERMNGRSALGFNSTRKDFRSYCIALNREFLSDIKKGRYVEPEVRRIIEKVPCYAEILKWVEWHNMAFIVTRELNLDTMVLYYEDYSTRFDEVTSELLSFLQQKAIYRSPEFQAFKEYRDYFTNEERQAAAIGIRLMALKETWEHVARYFQ